MPDPERGSEHRPEPEDIPEAEPVPATRGEPEPSEEKLEAMTWEDEGGPVLDAGIRLTLRGPDGADLEAALQTARDALPEGYRLERD